MKRMNQNKFNSNYLKPVKTKEYSEHKQRIDKILEMIDIKNIDIEMFNFLIENKTFKKEIDKTLKKYLKTELFEATDFVTYIINHRGQNFLLDKNGFIVVAYVPEEEEVRVNNVIKQAFHKAIKRNHYLVEDFELMFAY